MEFDFAKVSTHPTMIGALGALAGLKFAPGVSWFERFFNVVTGSLCASFLAPAASELLNMSSEPMRMAIAFVLGMFGMNFAAAVMTGIRDLKIGEILNKRFGGPQ